MSQATTLHLFSALPDGADGVLRSMYSLAAGMCFLQSASMQSYSSFCGRSMCNSRILQNIQRKGGCVTAIKFRRGGVVLCEVRHYLTALIQNKSEVVAVAYEGRDAAVRFHEASGSITLRPELHFSFFETQHSTLWRQSRPEFVKRVKCTYNGRIKCKHF